MSVGRMASRTPPAPAPDGGAASGDDRASKYGLSDAEVRGVDCTLAKAFGYRGRPVRTRRYGLTDAELRQADRVLEKAARAFRSTGGAVAARRPVARERRHVPRTTSSKPAPAKAAAPEPPGPEPSEAIAVRPDVPSENARPRFVIAETDRARARRILVRLQGGEASRPSPRVI